MFKLLFSNRWFALLWVGGMLASVAAVVGEDGAVEKLGKTAHQVADEQRELAAMASAPAEPEEEVPLTLPELPADPPNLEGEIFVNPETGQQIRIVRQTVSAEAQPDVPAE